MIDLDLMYGQSCDKNDLKINKAKEFMEAEKVNPFSTFVEVRKNYKHEETIIIDIEIEKPQKPKNDIRNVERVAICFTSDDNIPEVYALRDDFPNVSHLNLKSFDIPKCLCLYEESVEELKLQWSSFAYLERIREWMSLTAKGILHKEDQVLEPLLYYSTSYIVLPSDIFKESLSELLLSTEIVSHGIHTLKTKKYAGNIKYDVTKSYLTTVFSSSAVVHGAISRIPKNLKDLCELFQKCNIDLKENIRNRFRQWVEAEITYLFASKLIIVLLVPKKRSSESKIEDYEIRSFFTNMSVKELGIKLGLWGVSDGTIGFNFPLDNDDSDNVEIGMLNPVWEYTPQWALLLNNIAPEYENLKIFSVGMGTLGSQIYNILIRQGLGKWTLTDDDIFLPHNITRHILSEKEIGFHKADVLADYGNSMYVSEKIANSIPVNIFNTNLGNNKTLIEKINDSNIVLDFSASISVARKLANDIEKGGRRISAFFTPNALDSVMIAEDAERFNKLDMLEMQYYRGICGNEQLNDHLKKPFGKIRIGNSCRDISTILPFDLTVQHAGVISSGIKNALIEKKANISIWRSQKGGIIKYELPIYNEERLKFGDWTLVYDEFFIDKVNTARSEKFPNETGGAIIGSYDRQRKIIYVVDSIKSPDDSIEWPTVYIRGIKGLKRKIEHIETVSDRMLTYIGEWHSHPPNCSANPSPDDIQAFLWLAKVLNESGMLSLMLIVGEDYQFYLGKIVSE